MDGTLVDTEPHWIAAETPLVESYGGSWSDEQALELVGLGLEDAARIFQGAGVRLGVHEIIELLTDRVLESLRSGAVPFRPGAEALLRDLRDQEVTTALVTMSIRRMALEIVSLIEFPAFDLVIAGDDVTRPKPFPDPYLAAAEALGVDISETVAIEDSPNGVRSAVAAGCVVIGVPNIVSLTGTGAHHIVSSLEELDTAALRDLHRAQRLAEAARRTSGDTTAVTE